MKKQVILVDLRRAEADACERGDEETDPVKKQAHFKYAEAFAEEIRIIERNISTK